MKLADFGVSAKMATEATHVSKENPCGTPKYMAPEIMFQVDVFYHGEDVKFGPGSYP